MRRFVLLRKSAKPQSPVDTSRWFKFPAVSVTALLPALYHGCVPEAVNLPPSLFFLVLLFSGPPPDCPPSLLLPPLLRLAPLLRVPSQPFSQSRRCPLPRFSLHSIVPSLISPSFIQRVRDAWPLGRLVTWLLGYRPYRREKKDRKKNPRPLEVARIFRFSLGDC